MGLGWVVYKGLNYEEKIVLGWGGVVWIQVQRFSLKIIPKVEENLRLDIVCRMLTKLYFDIRS